MAECPICEADVDISEDTIEGELVVCSECGTELEVKQIDPAVLEKAPEEEEDWGE